MTRTSGADRRPPHNEARGGAAQLIVASTLAGTAALPGVGLFATAGRVVPVFACAAVAGVVAGWTVTRRRGATWLTWCLAVAAVEVLLLLTLGCVAAVSDGGLDQGAFATVAGGWLDGPAQLLTANLPLDADPPDVALLASVVVAASMAASALIVRGASTVTPVAPLVALFGAGVAVTAGTPARHGAATAAFVLLAGLFVVLRAAARMTWPDAGERPTSHAGAGDAGLAWAGRAAARGALPLALLTALLVPLGVWRPLTGDGGRADPRSLVTRRLDIRTRISPLSAIKAQLHTSPPAPLFDVTRVGQPWPHELIRVAALESYDGVTWTSAVPYAAAGHHFFPDARMTDVRTVAARVTVREPGGVLLPVVGYPVRLSGIGPTERRLAFSPESGTLIDLDGLRRGYSYEIGGDIAASEAGLAAARQTATADLAPYRVVPVDVPVEIQQLTETLTGALDSPLPKLKAIETHLRSLPHSTTVPAGHSYANLLRLLGTLDTRPAGGFAEQRAAAFALLARLAGVPTRVAVGYRLVGGPLLFTVTTQHAHAWPESYFPGLGWIPFEPTDVAALDVPPPPLVDGSVPRQPPPSPRSDLEPTAQPPPSRPQVAPGADAQPDTAARSLLWVSVLPLLGWAVLVGQKHRRRWSRRHRGLPADRVLGAWRETMDRLMEHGFRERAAETPRQTADRVTGLFDDIRDPLRALAALVTAAAFADAPPADQDVAAAWQHERTVWRALTGGRSGLVRKVRAVLDPRPLWRLRDRGRHSTRQP